MAENGDGTNPFEVGPTDDNVIINEDGELTFPDEVQAVITEIFPSDDPLEKADFNVVHYINTLFPTEQSLANLDDTVCSVENRMKTLDHEIKTAVRKQTSAGMEGQNALDDAQKAIKELFEKIKNIKERAEQSEQMVKEITRDIKQLDLAKRNLTVAITTHNHLHMLMSGVDTLQNLASKRQYGDAASLLQGVFNVMEHFESYKSIDNVRSLASKVEEIKRDMTRLVLSEFDSAFSLGGKGGINVGVLREACLVADVLEPSVKRELLGKFLKNQLAEYLVLFDASQDVAWLDKLDRRYAWVKRVLIDFEERMAQIFPENWEVSERIAVEFCSITHKELGNIMAQRKREIDVKLLLFAIQRTVNFENLLAKRLTGNTLRDTNKLGSLAPVKETNKDTEPNTNPFLENEDSSGEITSGDEASTEHPSKSKSGNPFSRLISSCFEPYLNIYIESQDRNLCDLMAKFQEDFLEQSKLIKAEASNCEGGVLPSCADLFVYYKKCMVQCSQLSTGKPLRDLAHLFQKYLKEYALRILTNNLPKTSSNSTVTLPGNISFSTVTNLLKDPSALKDLSQDVHRLSPGELTMVCSILTTADYCLETTQQLEDKLKEKVDTSLAREIDLSQERTAFTLVISNCIGILVQDLQTSCAIPLASMSKMSWTSIEHVGDQSTYVTAITGSLKQTIPLIRANLASARKYFTQFCIKFANSFIPRFISSLYKCKPITTVGAEQLLLDTHSLKTILLELPSIASQVARKAPSSYTKIVVKGMTKAEMLLKVVMTPHEPTKAFVSSCMRLLVDPDVETIQKVIEMKGLRKVEHSAIIDAFRAQVPANTTAKSNPSNSSSVDSDSSSRIRKLEKLIMKRL